MPFTPPLSLISTTQKTQINNNNKNIYKKTFNNTMQKRNRPEILFPWKIRHSETLKRNIPYSQALRLKRICTTKEDFSEQSKAVTKRLVERGYNVNEIQQQILKTFTIERAHLLNQNN